MSDPDKWYQHFVDLHVRDGYFQPDHKTRFILGSGAKYSKLKEMGKQRPVVNLVSPAPEATGMAKSELKEKMRTQIPLWGHTP